MELEINGVPPLPLPNVAVAFQYSGGLDDGKVLRSDAQEFERMRFILDWTLSEGGRVGVHFGKPSERYFYAIIGSTIALGPNSESDDKKQAAEDLGIPQNYVYKVVDRREVDGVLMVRCEYCALLSGSRPSY